MDKDLFIEGKEYISASRAAQKFGYAQDYIGALIRTKKVPGRMIWRAWYVEIESLVDHKKSRANKKTKNIDSKVEVANNTFSGDLPLEVEQNISLNEEVSLIASLEKEAELKSKTLFVGSPFTYEPDTRSRLPELSKFKYRHQGQNSLVRKLVVTSVSVLAIFFTYSGWIEYASPEANERVHIAVADIADQFEAEFSYFKTKLADLPSIQVAVSGLRAAAGKSSTNAQNTKNAGVSFFSSFSIHIKDFWTKWANKEEVLVGQPKITEADTVTDSLNGVVVVPNSSEHKAIVSKIKASFSDDVDISIDAEGDSGVITPVFRDGDDTEGYAFVLVPIKQK